MSRRYSWKKSLLHYKHGQMRCWNHLQASTGKTLTLLCAVLAWNEDYVRKQTDEREERHAPENAFRKLAPSTAAATDTDDFGPVTIFYASRTHSQLSQVVKEIKRTAYRPNVAVLGSREQMCIHPDLKNIHSSASVNSLCRQKVSKNACEFYKRVEDARKSRTYANEIMDIEDLVKFGVKHKACPYYLAKEGHKNADVVVLPYNYLVDAATRRSQNIKVKNSIIIFDEAHNLETTCGDATSFDLTPTDMFNIINEAQLCRDIAARPNFKGDYDAEDFEMLKALMMKLQQEINDITLPSHSKEVIEQGDYIYTLLERIKIHADSAKHLLKILDYAVALLAANNTNPRVQHNAIQSFTTILRMLYTGSNRETVFESSKLSRYYKVHITEERLAPFTGVRRDNSIGRKVSYWCFTAGLAMRSLIDEGVRCALLASGTLSPLDSFASEMQTTFNVRLENPHVIDGSQAYVAVVTRGPGGQPLNSSFETRSSPAYMTDLGNALVNFCRVIPDGVLIFFPSYGVMTDCIQFWSTKDRDNPKSIWERINQHKKAFIEPKTKHEFSEAMSEFYQMVDGETKIGAAFFAVCRGKVSEGVDFADARGRAVIVTGIPFASSHDPKVKLKRQYLDQLHAKDPKVINGTDWYKQQAIRAVNQAVGRVVRHRHDYGAIILLDERFASSNILNQLSLWVRPFVKVYHGFGEAYSQLTKFFKSMNAREVPSSSGASSTLPSLEAPSSLPMSTDQSDSGCIALRLSKERKRDAYAALRDQRPAQANDDGVLQKDLGNSSGISLMKNGKEETTRSTSEPTSAAKTYMRNVKSTLGTPGYREFQKILTKYKMKEKALEEVADALSKLFTSHQHIELLHDFQAFVPSKYRKAFCERIGIDLPDGENGKASKRPKIGDMYSVQEQPKVT
ncbi:hypothetical protein BZG36_02880 [Bifiguratus adelaidae]|uniref:Regulator of telomere elongation helicase 1 homolog n=1 Tax=Bifiguratus adelaidae TaxID=1938954 RepID=A0A261Y271_9FUNG|nr:hypothetical protein BZG36_02880 [Bifiguratus adelaidae]